MASLLLPPTAPNSQLPSPATASNSPQALPEVPGGLSLSPDDAQRLRSLPIEALDTLRSKLTQLLETVRTFDHELATTPLHATTLTYPIMLQKLLILHNHLQALAVALNTPLSASPATANLSAPRDAKITQSIGIAPRSLTSLPPGKEWQFLILSRTKPIEELDVAEAELLKSVPLPVLDVSHPPYTLKDVQDHIQTLTKAHDGHVKKCRKALRSIRYARPSNGDHQATDLYHGRDVMDPDLGGNNDDDDDDEDLGDEVWEWNARVEGEDDMSKLSRYSEMDKESEKSTLRAVVGFMNHGR